MKPSIQRWYQYIIIDKITHKKSSCYATRGFFVSLHFYIHYKFNLMQEENYSIQ